MNTCEYCSAHVDELVDWFDAGTRWHVCASCYETASRDRLAAENEAQRIAHVRETLALARQIYIHAPEDIRPETAYRLAQEFIDFEESKYAS